MDDDLAIALSIFLEVDEAAARRIGERLGISGKLGGAAYASGFSQTATKGVEGASRKAGAEAAKAAKDAGKAGASAAEAMVSGFKTALKQIQTLTAEGAKQTTARVKASEQQATNDRKASQATDLANLNHGLKARMKAWNTHFDALLHNHQTNNRKMEDAHRASLRNQSINLAADRRRDERIGRQGTRGGQVDVDARRAALDRVLIERRRRAYELGNEYKTQNAIELADIKRHNAAAIAADQRSGDRRTVLIRTMLNNMTRINQTGLSAILNMWRTHQQKKLESEASSNRRAEMELQNSMSRRSSIIKSGTQQQIAAQQQANVNAEKFNQATSSGILGVATGRSYALGGLIGGALGVKTAFNVLGEFQFIETAFRGIFREIEGGAPRTEKFLKEMQDFARRSPYEFEEVARSAQKMFTNRIVDVDAPDATDQVIDRLQRLADAAAATGKTSAQMKLALTGLEQIGSVGQLMMEETRQVTENLGLPIEKVAESLGMTVKEMREAMRKGEIDATTGLNAMFDAMSKIPGAAGAAERQSRTLFGSMSQLKDVGKQLIVQFLMPVAKAFTGVALVIGQVGDALLSADGGWKVARNALEGIVAAMTAMIAAKSAVEVVKLLGVALSAAVSAPVISGFVLLAGVLSTFSGVRETLGAFAEGTANWFLVGYRTGAVIDEFSNLVKMQSAVGAFVRTVEDFTTALVVGTKDWFLVGYRIGGVIDEFSNLVLLQSSLGAAARVIRDALGGIWRELRILGRTRDLDAFREHLGQIASDVVKGMAPIKDAFAKQFKEGVGEAKVFAYTAVSDVINYISNNMDRIISGARIAAGGATILKILGMAKGGNFAGAARYGIVSALAVTLVSAVKALTKDQTLDEFSEGMRDFIDKAIDRAFDAALIVGIVAQRVAGLVSDVWASIFGGGGGGDSADEGASASVADRIAATLVAAWDRAREILSSLAANVSEWFTTTFTSWVVNLPYKIGELLSSTLLEDEVIQALGTMAAGVGAAAAVIGVKFAQGFIMGVIRSIPDIARMFFDAIGGALGGDIGTEFAGAMLTSIVAAFIGFKGFKAISGLFSNLRVGFNADSIKGARLEMARLRKETQGTGNRMADLGMKARRAADGFIKIDYNWGEVAKSADKATAASAAATRAQSIAANAVRHYLDGWRRVGGVVVATGGRVGETIKNMAQAFGPKAQSNQKKSNELLDRFRATAGSGANVFHRMGDAIMRTSGLVETANGRWRSATTNLFVQDPTKNLTRIERISGQAFQRMGDHWNHYATRLRAGFTPILNNAKAAFTGVANAAKTGFSKAGDLARQYYDRAKGYMNKYRGDLTRSEFALSAGLSIGASAFSGYMVGMANSAEAMAASVLAAGGSIAQAWATGGPILGAVAAGAAVIGYFQAIYAKGAKKVAEAISRQAEATKASMEGIGSSVTRTFEELGNTGATAQRIGLLDAIKDGAAAGNVSLTELRDRYGITIQDMADLSAQGGDAIQQAFLKATRGVASDALEGDISAINTILAEMTENGTNFEKLLDTTFAQNINKAMGESRLSVEEFAGSMSVLQDVMDGKVSRGGMKKALDDLGLSASEIDAVMEAATDTLQGFLAYTDTGAFMKSLGPAMDKAIEDFRTQKLVTDELNQAMERAKTPVDRFVSAWERVKAAIDDTANAFRAYMDQVLGRELTLDNTTLAILSSAEAATRPQAEGEEAARFNAERRVATDEARYDVADAAAIFARESGTVEEAIAKTQQHIDGIIAGVSDPAMKEFLNGLKEDPKVIEAIRLAFANQNPIENFTEFKERYGDLIKLVENKPIADAITKGIIDGNSRQAIIQSLKDLEKESPELEAYIVKAGGGDKAKGYEAVYQEIISDVDYLTGLNPTITVQFDFAWGKVREHLNSVLPAFLRLPVAANYDGGYIPNPTLSTLAERGAEAVFPLTNPARMRQIMGIPQVARAFDAAGFGAPIAGTASNTNYAPVTVDQSQVNHFEIHESSPRMTADEIFRRQRKARFHGGHTLPVVIR